MKSAHVVGAEVTFLLPAPAPELDPAVMRCHIVGEVDDRWWDCTIVVRWPDGAMKPSGREPVEVRR